MIRGKMLMNYNQLILRLQTIGLMAIVITALLGTLFPLNGLQAAANCTPVEIRGIWLDAGAIPKTEKDIIGLVKSYKKANLNVIFPEVLCRGYAIYPTQLIARDPRFQNCIDPLQILISEAHKNNIEVHPWVWVFRAGYTADKGSILKNHPDWTELSKYGDELSVNGGLWISPANDEARAYLLSLYKELITKYDVDGLHLDYIRYEIQSPAQFGYNKIAIERYKNLYNINPLEIDPLTPSQINWNRFRERLINTFVQQISLECKSVKPNLIISAAVGSELATARLNLMQNWGHWVDNRWVDFITPMAYTSDDNRFVQFITYEKAAAGNKTLIAPGIGIHLFKDNPQKTVNQIGITRQLGVFGQALFAASYFTPELGSSLAASSYSKDAELPYRNTSINIKTLNDNGDDFSKLMACNLSEYLDYKTKTMPYILPTDPPLDLPKNPKSIPSVEIIPSNWDIIIDGNISDSAWSNARPVSLQYTNMGDRSPVETKVLLTYNREALFVGFICKESLLNKITAQVTKRDGPVFYDDSVEVFIDPSRTKRSYYHLSTNTKGAQFDQQVLTPAWNGNWTTSSKFTIDGWISEMKIPFADFKMQTPSPGDIWGINLTRNRTVTGSKEYLTWSVPYGSFHNPERFGKIIF